MAWNPAKVKTWNKNSPADGSELDIELNRIYDNLLYLNNLQAALNHFFIFASLEEIIPSASNPFLDIGVDHASVSILAYPQLIPFFRNFKLNANGVSQFDVVSATKYDANSTLELTLDVGAEEMIDDRLEDLLFNTDSSPITGALIDNWGMVVKAVTDIGDGPGKISAGAETYIKLTNNDILNTLNPVGLKLGIGYSGGSNSIGTIAGAKIEIYPFRRGVSGALSDTSSIIWRKVDDAVLRDGITGSRVRDKFQGHRHSLFSQFGGTVNQMTLDRGIDGAGNPQVLAGTTTLSSSPGYINIHDPIADQTNGDPRYGIRTRDRSLGVRFYLNAKECNL